MTSASTAATPAAWPDVRFRPRRLGHVNMYVGDLEASFAFYHDVCGLELVFDEPGIVARFLSNGNSHHDVALMGVTRRELLGRDGQVQVSSERGSQPGLNHLAFEMETEAALVHAIQRMADADLPIDRLYDHQISRSAYIPTPWKVDVELYADTDRDWRGVYARVDGELLSEHWRPGGSGPPSELPQYVDVLDHRPVLGALAQPLRTSSATVAVPDLEAAIDYYERIVGLTVAAVDRGVGRWAVLGGSLGRADLQLLEHPTPGFHHFTLQLADEHELAATTDRVRAAGVPIERTLEHERKRSIVVLDPDGVPVELAAYRGPVAVYAALGGDVDPGYVI